MRRIVLRSVLGMVALATIVGTTQAEGGFLTETVSTAPGGTATDFALSLPVPKFHPTQGILTGVTITFSDSELMHGFVYNSAPRTESYLVTESSLFSLALGATQLLSNTLSSTQNCAGMAAHTSGTFGIFQANGSTSPISLTSGSAFNAFVGAGSVDVSFSSLTSTTVIGGGGNASTGIYTSADATVTVVYNYLPAAPPVPEPSSLSMCLLAIVIGSASFARTRWRSSQSSRAQPKIR